MIYGTSLVSRKTVEKTINITTSTLQSFKAASFRGMGWMPRFWICSSTCAVMMSDHGRPSPELVQSPQELPDKLPSRPEPVRMSCLLGLSPRPLMTSPASLKEFFLLSALSSEYRLSMLSATLTLFAFNYGPLPMRSRALSDTLQISSARTWTYSGIWVSPAWHRGWAIRHIPFFALRKRCSVGSDLAEFLNVRLTVLLHQSHDSAMRFWLVISYGSDSVPLPLG